MRKHLVALTLTGSLGLLASPALAQVYPPADESGAAVSSTVVEPGETVTFRASGFRPFSTVTVTISLRPLALESSVGAILLSSATSQSYTAQADAAGVATFALPLSSSGVHLIQATGVDPSGAARTVTSSVTVAEASGSAGSGAQAGGRDTDRSSALPTTGASIAATVALATGFVAVGVGAQVAGRRRRNASA